MSLRQYVHGTCCGACIIDGFYDAESEYHKLIANEHSEASARERAKRYPDHEDMLEDLRRLVNQTNSTAGQVTVVLNQYQQPGWHDDLLRFGFKLINADVSNPNHPDMHNSQLFTYMRFNRPFRGDRVKAGFPEEGTAPGTIAAPPPPPPPPPVEVPPAPTIPRAVAAAVTWGRPIG